MCLKPYQLLKYNNNVLYTKDNKKSLSNLILKVAKFGLMAIIKVKKINAKQIKKLMVFYKIISTFFILF